MGDLQLGPVMSFVGSCAQWHSGPLFLGASWCNCRASEGALCMAPVTVHIWRPHPSILTHRRMVENVSRASIFSQSSECLSCVGPASCTAYWCRLYGSHMVLFYVARLTWMTILIRSWEFQGTRRKSTLHFPDRVIGCYPGRGGFGDHLWQVVSMLWRTYC